MLDQALERRAAVGTRTKDHAEPAWLQEILSSFAGVGVRKLAIPFGAEKGVRCDQCAGADPGDHRERGSRARLRKPNQSTGAERAVCAPTGKSQNVEGLLGPHRARLLCNGGDGEFCELLVGAQCSYGFPRFTRVFRLTRRWRPEDDWSARTQGEHAR